MIPNTSLKHCPNHKNKKRYVDDAERFRAQQFRAIKRAKLFSQISFVVLCALAALVVVGVIWAYVL